MLILFGGLAAYHRYRNMSNRLAQLVLEMPDAVNTKVRNLIGHESKTRGVLLFAL